MASPGNKYACSFCNETTNSKESLRIHLLNHSSENTAIVSSQVFNNNDLYPTIDRVSGEIESNISSIRNRAKKQNKSTSQFNTHTCSTCGKEFKRKEHLSKHFSVHSGLKPYTCLICGKSFARKDRLKEHCSIHVSNGWLCYFCGKMFSQRCILRVHEMIHRGIKPYICDLCDNSFSRNNDLRRHRTSHTGEKNHFCEVCGKGFSQKRLVNRHLLTHKNNLKS